MALTVCRDGNHQCFIFILLILITSVLLWSVAEGTFKQICLKATTAADRGQRSSRRIPLTSLGTVERKKKKKPTGVLMTGKTQEF